MDLGGDKQGRREVGRNERGREKYLTSLMLCLCVCVFVCRCVCVCVFVPGAGEH